VDLYSCCYHCLHQKEKHCCEQAKICVLTMKKEVATAQAAEKCALVIGAHLRLPVRRAAVAQA
jgi:hypothetical protein